MVVPSDRINESELRVILKGTTDLGNSWRRKGHQPFIGGEDSRLALTTLLREWSKHVEQEWRTIDHPEAVRAFHASAISGDLSEEIKRAATREATVGKDTRTYTYHRELWSATIAYLNKFHSRTVHITALIQKVLGEKQGQADIFTYLDGIRRALLELAYEGNGSGAQIHAFHINAAVRNNLNSPYNAWWYETVGTILSSSLKKCIDTISYEDIQEAIRRVKEKALSLGHLRQPGTDAPSQPTRWPATFQVATSTSSSTSVNAVAPSLAATTVALKEPPVTKESPSEHRPRVKATCFRCFSSEHQTVACDEERPHKENRRCKCGSFRHPVSSCKLEKAGSLSCERCESKDHRSGMCPYSLVDIRKGEHKKGPGNKGNATNVVFSPDLPLVALEDPSSLSMTFHVGQIEHDTLHFNRSGPVCTELVIGQSPHAKTVKAVLDSGAGYNYAQPAILEALGSCVQWLKPEGEHAIQAVGVSGEMMPTNRVAIVSVSSPKRPHDVHRLRFLCPETLLPTMLLGVEGLKTLRIGMTFDASGVHAYSGVDPEQALVREEETRPQELPRADTDDIIACVSSMECDTQLCIFDTVNFLGAVADSTFTECGLDHDYSFELYATAAGNLPLLSNKLDLKEALPLERALDNPHCSFRGTYADELQLDSDGMLSVSCTRFLHDFSWYEDSDRLTPTDGNLTFAKSHAYKLAKSLKRRGLLSAYTNTFEEYLSRGYIQPLEAPTDQAYFTPHFPVIKGKKTPDGEVGRCTAVRPVFDWRVGNQAQKAGVNIDRGTWECVAYSRLYKYCIWADLKAAFLNCRVPERTMLTMAFVLANIEGHEDAPTYRYFQFLGPAMGISGSPAVLQLSGSIMIAESNERTAARLTGRLDDPEAYPIKLALDGACLATPEERHGLHPKELSLQRPSEAARTLRRAVLKVEDANLRLLRGSSSWVASSTATTAEDGDDLLKNTMEKRIALCTHSYLNHSARGRYMDDYVVAADSQREAETMYDEDGQVTKSRGQHFSEKKTKRSWDPTVAEGLGIIWTAKDEFLPRPVDTSLYASETLTVRGLLSAVHTCYDVLGHASWILLKLKKILRCCFVAGLQMDSRLSPGDRDQACSLLHLYNETVTTCSVPRYVDVSEAVFLYTDAAMSGYGMVIAGTDVGNPYLCSARLPPLPSSSYSIVRKESSAFLWGLQVFCAHMQYFPHSLHRHYYLCTDSTIVKARVEKVMRMEDGQAAKKLPKGWTSWEWNITNRIVRLIRQIVCAIGPNGVGHTHLIHCPSSHNLADPYSRGIDPHLLDRGAAQQWVEMVRSQHEASREVDHVCCTLSHADLGTEAQLFDNPGQDAVVFLAASPDADTESDIYSYVVSLQQKDAFTAVCRRIVTGDDSNFDKALLESLVKDVPKDERARLKATFEVQSEDGQAVLRLKVGHIASQSDGALYIPSEARNRVLSMVHVFFCHRPSKYMYHYMLSRYYWKNLSTYVRSFCKSCPACQMAKGTGSFPDTAPKLLSRDFGANNFIVIAWLGPVSQKEQAPYQGQDPQPRYALHIYDPSRRFNYFGLSPDKSALSARRLLQSYCWTFGFPLFVTCDADRSFCSAEVMSFAHSVGLKVLPGISYAPFRQAYMERVHKEVWSSIRAIQLEEKRRNPTMPTTPWYELLPAVAFVLNQSACEEFGYHSPNDLTFTYNPQMPPKCSGYRPNQQLQIFVNKLESESGDFPLHSATTYQALLKDRRDAFHAAMDEFHRHLDATLYENQLKVVGKHRRRHQSTLLKAGTPLWIKASTGFSKLSPRWVGPVLYKAPTSSDQIAEIESLSGKPMGKVHLSRVKLAHLSMELLEDFKKLEVKSSPASGNSGPEDHSVVNPPQLSPPRHFLGENETTHLPEIQRSVVPLHLSTGLWIACDTCNIWCEVPEHIYMMSSGTLPFSVVT
ncbi:gag/pol/env polyprotein, putative [Perkinsus marinus ATCC 50983]|uniref:Gag/pol/env polyprotein, putative n=1 Tax=Perkinsus marinus (strain ATCC 50983 / TXsc) TaxID=423536 RepID=C5KWX7_PERM5|nr:gag/pol/env polyprotein, putative [Perkinsus marinus ATCC 50983]EER10981.1 gag/pol/env polyprotein, putative [Perkinsus marinus ATCC 50983]|eukprot:XP_002779186.1 gag/pol/env polyprotein, putative [Perkinsus marinus ATCC 50983]